MSRAVLWGSLAGITPVESVLYSAYEEEEKYIWENNIGNSPHGMPWFTSLHASSFPGDDDTVCGRAQVYDLMNPASSAPHDPKTRALFELGHAIEHMHIKRLSNAGVLLTADVTGDDEFQTGFEDPDCWLTGSPDAIILPPFATKSHVLDVKSTKHENLLKMISDPLDTPYSHSKNERQVKCYIGEANEKFSPTVVTCVISGVLIKNGRDKCCKAHIGNCVPKIIKVEPPDDGTIFYCSREEPITCTKSYYVSLDLDFMKSGKEKLKKWKTNFIEDRLPAHIHEGQKAKWTVGECKYCSHKSSGYCKRDYKNKTVNLSESDLIEYTKSIRPNYDYGETREEVLSRWVDGSK